MSYALSLPRRMALSVDLPMASWFVRDVLLPFIVTRALLTLAGLVALAVARDGLDGSLLGSADWLNVWSAWDSEWYLSIARDGYTYVPGEQSSAAFAPAFPLLMRLGALLVGSTHPDVYLATGMIVSNLALLATLGYLLALVRLDFDAGVARRAVLYVLVFPTTLFLSAVYPHSLFLALTIAAFYYARHGRWWLVGVLGALAGLTRLHAMLIVLPLAYEYLAARQFDLRRVRPDILTLGLVPLGGVAFAAYVFTISGEPLAVLKAGSAWGRQLTPPWEVVLPYLVQPSGTHGYFEVSILDFGFTLLMLALTIFTWHRVRPSYALFMGLFLLVVVSSGTLTSSMRYALELFPLFIGLAIWGRRRLFDRAYLGVAAYMALVFMHRFAAQQWLA